GNGGPCRLFRGLGHRTAVREPRLQRFELGVTQLEEPTTLLELRGQPRDLALEPCNLVGARAAVARGARGGARAADALRGRRDQTQATLLTSRLRRRSRRDGRPRCLGAASPRVFVATDHRG